MPERQSRHPDNDLIDKLQKEETPSHQGRHGGDINTRIGAQDELNRVSEPDNREPTTGSDNPTEDWKKGPKTREALQEERNRSS